MVWCELCMQWGTEHRVAPQGRWRFHTALSLMKRSWKLNYKAPNFFALISRIIFFTYFFFKGNSKVLRGRKLDYKERAIIEGENCGWIVTINYSTVDAAVSKKYLPNIAKVVYLVLRFSILKTRCVRLDNFSIQVFSWKDFHRIGPLGRFGLVVAMSVRVFLFLSVPSPCDFFASVDWCGGSLVHGLVWIVRRPCVEP